MAIQRAVFAMRPAALLYHMVLSTLSVMVLRLCSAIELLLLVSSLVGSSAEVNEPTVTFRLWTGDWLSQRTSHIRNPLMVRRKFLISHAKIVTPFIFST